MMQPVKTRELINAHIDSRIWNDFRFRDDDIVIANWAKSGCTWLQQIVCQLVFNDARNVSIAEVSPWVEFAYAPRSTALVLLEKQTHRRFVKTHLPVDALVFSPHAKYLYIGRDGRDVVWSLFNHLRGLSDAWYKVMQRVRGAFGPLPAAPPTDFRHFFNRWLDDDGYPFWPFWPSVRSWWEIRDLPNVLLVHFTELKTDLPAAIRRIAEFLDITIPAEKWSDVVERCTFSYMKSNAHHLVADGNRVFVGGATTFFNRGENSGGRWLLLEQDHQRYEAARNRLLPADCANWLTSGVAQPERRLDSAGGYP